MKMKFIEAPKRTYGKFYRVMGDIRTFWISFAVMSITMIPIMIDIWRHDYEADGVYDYIVGVIFLIAFLMMMACMHYRELIHRTRGRYESDICTIDDIDDDVTYGGTKVRYLLDGEWIEMYKQDTPLSQGDRVRLVSETFVVDKDTYKTIDHEDVNDIRLEV